MLDPDQLLDGGAQDLGLARLLRHILPGMLAMRVADDDDERGAGIQRLDQTCHQIGGAGAERRIGKADAARDFGIGIGREDAGALIIDEVMIEAKAARRIIEGQELKATHAEHRAAMEGLDHAGERFAAGHLIGAHGVAHWRTPLAAPLTSAQAAAVIAASLTRTASSTGGA